MRERCGGKTLPLDLRPTLHGKWYRTGVPGVEGCIISPLWIRPPRPTSHSCNWCFERFSISHTLGLKKGGLVNTCHKKLCAGVTDLTRKAFTHFHVRNAPLVQNVCEMWGVKTHPDRELLPENPPQATEDSEQKGYLITQDLWKKGAYSIHDMHFMSNDSNSYL